MGVALRELVAAWRDVAATDSRTGKVERLASLLRGARAESALLVAHLTGELRQGRIGVGPAAIAAARQARATNQAALSVVDVDEAMAAVAGERGRGSARRRAGRLRGLFGRATADEQDFLTRLLLGELRQGALEGVMAEAVALAADLPADSVRRAAMLSGHLPDVARAALMEGAAGLAAIRLQPFRPVQPMLAGTAENVGDAIARIGAAAFEYKMDGARIQVHKSGDIVRIFSRQLNEVTASLPEIAETARMFPARELILDGEVLALSAGGAPLPFQITMRRFGRRSDVERLRNEIPLHAFFFDCLLSGGQPLIDLPGAERYEWLADAVPESLRVPRLVTSAADQARAFFARAREAGHEGLIAKSLVSGYDAGARGGDWLKIKPAHALDLVVLAAEWGHGRRRGWLSNLHLGARDDSGFVMLGKTFKGLTDRMLEWQTRALLEREISRDGRTVHVRPELVVEVAFNDVQVSSRYPGGVALRFARVRRYRTDKNASDADTIQRVLALRHPLAADGQA